MEFKKLFLFWFGDGDEQMIANLDNLILPNVKGGMDASGYALHALAERFNGASTTTQEAFDRIYGGNCDYHEAQGINVPLHC